MTTTFLTALAVPFAAATATGAGAIVVGCDKEDKEEAAGRGFRVMAIQVSKSEQVTKLSRSTSQTTRSSRRPLYAFPPSYLIR